MTVRRWCPGLGAMAAMAFAVAVARGGGVRVSDFDADGDVDMVDFAHFRACMSGALLPPATGCADADLDVDVDVDMGDYALFQGCFSAPNVIASVGCRAMRSAIPARPANGVGGTAFVAEVTPLSLAAREARILTEIQSGNLAEFLRAFVPVAVTAAGPSGATHHGTLLVAPDVLAVGSDGDFVRMPMRPGTAQSIADGFGCVLPTRKMVNAIYAAAAVKLAPSPFSPATYDITSVHVFHLSHLRIEEQRAGQPLGLLVGGIKKDVVETPQLATRPGKVAIYGWHQLNGTPIQPLYVGHADTWVDYSHSIRLVASWMEVDGQRRRVTDVAADAELSSLISDEGPFTWVRY